MILSSDQQFHFLLELGVMGRGAIQSCVCGAEGTALYLMALEEGRDFQRFSNGLQPVPVGDLKAEMVRVLHPV